MRQLLNDHGQLFALADRMKIRHRVVLHGAVILTDTVSDVLRIAGEIHMPVIRVHAAQSARDNGEHEKQHHRDQNGGGVASDNFPGIGLFRICRDFH